MYTYKEAWKLAHSNLNLHKTKEELLKQDLFDYYQKDSQQILDPIAQTNSLNYRYEMPDVTLNHIYAIS